ncbi:MAG: hypothetical protein ACRC62_33140 [Microcoleus sp.]
MKIIEKTINLTKGSIREILGVELDEIRNSDGGISYEVILLTLGGDRLCFCSSSNRREQQKITELIRSYLNARSH